QVYPEPGEALPKRLAGGRERPLVAGYARETIDVLRRLILDDVDDVVHRDYAYQLVLLVHDRDGEQVVGRDLTRNLFLVRVDAGADQVGGHDPLERGFGRDEQQPAQRDDADQMPALVDDVEIEHHLHVPAGLELRD